MSYVVGVLGGARAMEGGIRLVGRSDDEDVVRSRMKGGRGEEEVLVGRGYEPIDGGGGGNELRLKCNRLSSLPSAEGSVCLLWLSNPRPRRPRPDRGITIGADRKECVPVVTLKGNGDAGSGKTSGLPPEALALSKLRG